MNENVELLDALEDSIDLLVSGQSIDQCIQCHPRHGQDLRPILELGIRIQSTVGDFDEISRAKNRVRAQFDQELSATSPPDRAHNWSSSTRLTQVYRLIAGVLFLFASICILAQSSLPGDVLYPAKRWTEQIGLVLSNYAPAFQDYIAQRRRNEVQQVIQIGREIDLVFNGRISRIMPDSFIVAGIAVYFESDVTSNETYHLGDLVEVWAQSTKSGQIIGQRLMLLNQNEGEGLSLPSATDTITATNSPSPTHTATEPSDTPSATDTVTATNSPSPTHTATEPSDTPSAIHTTTATDTPTPLYEPEVDHAPNMVSGTCKRILPTGWYRYRVQVGDTLSSIAAQTCISIETLARVNCIENQSLIVVGQEIFIPCDTNQVRRSNGATIPANSTSISEPEDSDVTGVTQTPAKNKTYNDNSSGDQSTCNDSASENGRPDDNQERNNSQNGGK